MRLAIAELERRHAAAVAKGRRLIASARRDLAAAARHLDIPPTRR